MNKPPDWARSLGLLSVITADFLGFTLGGIFLGYLGNKYFDLPLWVSVLLGFFGLGLAIYRLTRYVKRDFE